MPEDYIIAPQDNTFVSVPIKQLPKRQVAMWPEGMIYDSDKAQAARNLQNLYNTSYFGAGQGGALSIADPRTPEGQEAIRQSMRYAVSNAKHLFESLAAGYYGYPRLFINGVTTDVADLAGYKIGEGAEASVFDNSPRTVVKVTDALDESRNAVPFQVKLKRAGTIMDDGESVDVFTQPKVAVVDEDAFPVQVRRLDKKMAKKGWKPLKHEGSPNYRSYVKEGQYITDVAPGNIGINKWGQPVFIDAQPLGESEFFELTNGENILPAIY